MKKLLTLAAAAAVITAGSSAAWAQNVDQKVLLKGEVAKECTGGTGTSTVVSGGTGIQPDLLDPSFVEVDFEDISAGMAGKSVTVTRKAVACNFLYSLTIRSRDGGFQNKDYTAGSGQTVNGFTTCFPYEITASHEKLKGTLDPDCTETDVKSDPKTASEPASGDLVIAAQKFSGAKPVAGGQFRDLITVRVGNAL